MQQGDVFRRQNLPPVITHEAVWQSYESQSFDNKEYITAVEYDSMGMSACPIKLVRIRLKKGVFYQNTSWWTTVLLVQFLDLYVVESKKNNNSHPNTRNWTSGKRCRPSTAAERQASLMETHSSPPIIPSKSSVLSVSHQAAMKPGQNGLQFPVSAAWLRTEMFPLSFS